MKCPKCKGTTNISTERRPNGNSICGNCSYKASSLDFKMTDTKQEALNDKSKGFYQKYKVEKISNPAKVIDAVVLEFDDPIARKGIRAWVTAMVGAGYDKAAAQASAKCDEMDLKQGVMT